MTPTISELIPPFGSSLGGTLVKIIGTSFGNDWSKVIVLLEA